MTERAVLYSAVGDELTRWEIDAGSATLERRETVMVPSNVQYAWPHPSRRALYVATSNRGSAPVADYNHLSAWRIDPASGALSPLGDVKRLRERAVHICVTPSGSHVLSGHNIPRPGITRHVIEADLSLGAEVPEPVGPDYGIYPHQVMVTPDGRAAILVDRGNDAAKGKPEDPGALRFYRLDDGSLADIAAIAPGGGYGFGPRHLDFHPTRPWVYVSLERQNVLHMFRRQGDAVEAAPAWVRDSLEEPANCRPRQLAGTIHVHPSGRHVYLVNRADWTVEHDGANVFNGGENSIAVYSIDPASGEPTLIQHARLPVYHVRTFAFDPTGRVMVAASIQPIGVREGEGSRIEPAGLAVFRVREDGRLEFARKYDVPTGGKLQYWMGIVGLD